MPALVTALVILRRSDSVDSSPGPHQPFELKCRSLAGRIKTTNPNTVSAEYDNRSCLQVISKGWEVGEQQCSLLVRSARCALP